MSKTKPRLIRIISLRDILLIFLALTVKRFLDFLWEKTKPKLRFEGRTHIKEILFVMFGQIFIDLLYITLPYPNEANYRKHLRDVLEVHLMWHKLFGGKPCMFCEKRLVKDRRHLEKYVPDSKFYPPFNF